MLKIGAKLSLPLDAVTQTFGVLSIRGAGKSNLAAVMAEEMYAAGLPFVVIDPVGSWWGLRSSGDGKGPGLAVPIFGGRHGDVPIERNKSGELLADLIVDERLSCVVDLSDFDSEAAKKQFLLSFAKRLYRRNTEPLHLFLEEADDYIPQRPMRDEAQLLRAWENIVRRGRARGLGLTMITQRSAVLNKNVLEQIETLFVLRTTGPRDRKAIEGWIKHNAMSGDVMQSLPGLQNGEAWIWSPHWLGKIERHKIKRRRTFDSGATPKHKRGKKRTASLADIDLPKLQREWDQTIETAEANDPKLLKAKVRKLSAKLSKAEKQQQTKTVEVPVIKPEDLKKFAANVDKFKAAIEKLLTIADTATKTITALSMLLEPFRANRGGVPKVAGFALETKPRAPRVPIVQRDHKPDNESNGERKVGPGERAILIAIAARSADGFNGAHREQLTVLTGYKRSTRNTYLQRLLAANLIYETAGRFFATEAGVDLLGDDYEPLPTGAELQRYWLEKLPEGEAKILELLLINHPRPVTREGIGLATSYKRSTRNTYLQRMKSRGIVQISGDAVSAREELFE